jgi:putative intracellular protease/amidase
MPFLHTRAGALSAADRAAARGKRVLFMLPPAGAVPQEILKPADLLKSAGVNVTFATLDEGGVRFDPLSIALAVLESPWDPTLRSWWRAHRSRAWDGLPSLRRMARDGSLDAWLGAFEMIVVPGGHGRRYAAFIRDPLLVETVAGFFTRRRVVGLVCHGPYVAALPEAGKLISGRAVACWPRWVERLLRPLPWLGTYMVPYGRPVGELLTAAGAVVYDSFGPSRRAHAVTDGQLVTARGPWSMSIFADAALAALARSGA